MHERVLHACVSWQKVTRPTAAVPFSSFTLLLWEFILYGTKKFGVIGFDTLSLKFSKILKLLRFCELIESYNRIESYNSAKQDLMKKVGHADKFTYIITLFHF